MGIFESGRIIKTVSGNEIKITGYVGSGSRHDVYSAEYNKQNKALVWYKEEFSPEEKTRAKERLEKHISMENPNICFLWPLDITEETEEGFGYIVDYRGLEYKSVSDVLNSDIKFTSKQDVIDACMRIVNAFNALHEQELCYVNINAKNVFVNPLNGDVAINYLDNVVPFGTVPTMGTLEFTAPELCSQDGKNVNDATDVYAFSVLVFMLLFNHHPLEGARWLVPFLTDSVKRELYIDNPVFIFDENDTSNAPSPYVQKQVTEIWRSMPLYAQSFLKAVFSKDSLMCSKNRAGAKEWLVLLARLRNDMVKCSCGNEVIVKNNSSADCKKCGHAINIEFVLALPDFRVTIHKGTRIYKCLLGKFDSKEAMEPAFVVAARTDQPNIYGLKNVTKDVVNAVTPSGAEKAVEQQALIPFMDGISMTVYDVPINIKKKA